MCTFMLGFDQPPKGEKSEKDGESSYGTSKREVDRKRRTRGREGRMRGGGDDRKSGYIVSVPQR